jgi:hypothetical protein
MVAKSNLLQELAYVPNTNPKAKTMQQVMITPTNSIEMTPLKLRM